MSPTYGIGEIANVLGLSADALRYYERIDVVPPAPRDSGGRRRYRDEDLHLLQVLLHLRDTGMPLSDIAQFTHFVQQDPNGVTERLDLLVAHRTVIEERIARLNESLDVVKGKIDDYRARLQSPTQ